MEKSKINALIFPVIIFGSVLLTLTLNDRTLKPIEQKLFDIERIVFLLMLVILGGVVFYVARFVF